MLVVGLDIGGANLKAATSDGAAIEMPFALWRAPDKLQEQIESLLIELPRPDAIAVTMTGELADCFASKIEGVGRIVDAAVRAARGTQVYFWQTGGEFVSADEAIAIPRLVAAANWHALATFCGRAVPHGAALLIDIGSTTTDVVPLFNGRVAAEGLTDWDRLRCGELVYTGAARTPICAFGPTVTLADREVSLAAELFATTRDAYLVLGDLSENANDFDTADGRPATVEHARARLARMLCSDPHEFDDDTILRLAVIIAKRQRALIRGSLDRVLDRLAAQPHLLISGSGSFLAEQVIAETPRLADSPTTSLAALFEKRVSHSACAFAVARLGSERLG